MAKHMFRRNLSTPTPTVGVKRASGSSAHASGTKRLAFGASVVSSSDATTVSLEPPSASVPASESSYTPLPTVSATSSDYKSSDTASSGDLQHAGSATSSELLPPSSDLLPAASGDLPPLPGFFPLGADDHALGVPAFPPSPPLGLGLPSSEADGAVLPPLYQLPSPRAALPPVAVDEPIAALLNLRGMKRTAADTEFFSSWLLIPIAIMPALAPLRAAVAASVLHWNSLDPAEQKLLAESMPAQWDPFKSVDRPPEAALAAAERLLWFLGITRQDIFGAGIVAPERRVPWDAIKHVLFDMHGFGPLELEDGSLAPLSTRAPPGTRQALLDALQPRPKSVAWDRRLLVPALAALPDAPAGQYDLRRLLVPVIMLVERLSLVDPTTLPPVIDTTRLHEIPCATVLTTLLGLKQFHPKWGTTPSGEMLARIGHVRRIPHVVWGGVPPAH
jgi:hypothetical protein